ncbi:hypothetical protein Tco_0958631 [Tanacetum coccineum]
MTTLLFADTHNLVAFLDKPAEVGRVFEQIVDFLNASSIRYALTVNPTIYTSCIQQFWATTKVKTVNGEILQLEDAEGMLSIPMLIFFEQLALMGYEKPSQKLTFYKAFFSPQWKFFIHTILQCLSAKSTTWNEFSGTMASVIICLDINQKFNFPKYIFESMVKNVDSSVKFLMYPRFVQVFLNQQADDMSNHKRIYVTPSYTKKVFGNIKRGGKGFSGRVTPLFPAMMVQAQQEIEQKLRKPKRKDTEILQSVGLDREPIANRVLDLEHTKTTQALEIKSLKRRVNKLEKKQRSRTPKLKRLFKVGRTAQVVSSKDEDVFNGEEVITEQDVVEKEVSTADPVTTTGEVVTTASVEVVIQEPVQSTATTVPSTIPKAKSITFRDPDESTTRPTTTPTEEEEQARLAREKAEEVKEANISWDNVQAMIEVDRLLAERLPSREQEELIDKRKRKLFVELLEKKKKHVAALRAQEKEDKPQLKHKRKGQKDLIWRNLQGKKVLLWRLYDSCRVHFVRFEDMHVYMLVEKRYPLTPVAITDMLNKKLKSDYWNEMCYQLLKLMTKQLKKQ